MNNQRKKLSIGLASLVLVLICAVGGTLAWMHATSDPVTNTFVPATVTTTVIEDTTDGTKKDVKIQNTGDVDAYIRAAIVVNLVDDNGNVTVAKPEHYTMDGLPGQDWLDVNGYYYYQNKVPAGEVTPNVLFSACKATENIPEGLSLQVTILAEGVQADGTDAEGIPAVELAWKTVTIGDDGRLTVKS